MRQPLLWDKLTVAEHFELSAQAYGLADEAAATSRDALFDELGFARYVDYRVEALSGGTRPKLNLALALDHEPALLLLDEPYAGFDRETYLRGAPAATRCRFRTSSGPCTMSSRIQGRGAGRRGVVSPGSMRPVS